MFKLVDKISQVMAVVAMAVLVFMMLFIFVSVCGRYFFGRSIPDDVVIMQALLVIVVFLPFAYVQTKKEHLSVSILTDYLPIKAQYVFELLGLIVGIVFVGMVTAASLGDTLSAYADDAIFDGVLNVPSWPARGSVALGAGFLTLKLFADFIKALMDGPDIARLSHQPEH